MTWHSESTWLMVACAAAVGLLILYWVRAWFGTPHVQSYDLTRLSVGTPVRIEGREYVVASLSIHYNPSGTVQFELVELGQWRRDHQVWP